jgi:hypothetical protein
MSKRFFDTGLWEKPWFMELTPSEKLAWIYILSHCDNVGVWTPNYRLAEFQIGQQLDWDKFREKCNGNIFVLDSGKWFVIDFCRFQHPDLKPSSEDSKNNAVLSYIRELKGHGLWDSYKVYLETGEIDLGPSKAPKTPVGRPQSGPKERKGKGKGTGTGTGTGKGGVADDFYQTEDGVQAPMNRNWYERLCREYGKTETNKYIEKAIRYSIQKTGDVGYYKNYASAAEDYMERDGYPKKPKPYSGKNDVRSLKGAPDYD